MITLKPVLRKLFVAVFCTLTVFSCQSWGFYDQLDAVLNPPEPPVTPPVGGVAPTIVYSSSLFTVVQNTVVNITPTLTGEPFTDCISSPALPDGLIIDVTTCAISGTPTTLQAATYYIITAFNSFGNGTATISIEVIAGTPVVNYCVLGTATLDSCVLQ